MNEKVTINLSITLNKKYVETIDGYLKRKFNWSLKEMLESEVSYYYFTQDNMTLSENISGALVAKYHDGDEDIRSWVYAREIKKLLDGENLDDVMNDPIVTKKIPKFGACAKCDENDFLTVIEEKGEFVGICSKCLRFNRECIDVKALNKWFREHCDTGLRTWVDHELNAFLSIFRDPDVLMKRVNDFLKSRVEKGQTVPVASGDEFKQIISRKGDEKCKMLA